MRTHRGNGASSRAEQRKSKADRLLNWTIGIVSLLILAVGCIILISVFNTSDPQPAAKPAGSQAQSDNQSGSSPKNNQDSSSADSGESDSSQVTNDDSSSTAGSSSTGQVSDESHQASYDIGSDDWNAQVSAISEATGIDQSNMTVRWLGNGGSPNSSLARVAPKNDQNSIYVVHLIFQNGKWQADNVKKPGE